MKDKLTYLDDGVSRSWYFRGMLIDRTHSIESHSNGGHMIRLVRRLREIVHSEFGDGGFDAMRQVWYGREEQK